VAVRQPLTLGERGSADGVGSLHRPIFVLGIDRSGTSMVSELLSHWGAYAGRQEDLCRADEGNPQGYWEYKPMQDFFNDLISGTRVSLWDPAFKEAIRREAADPAARRRALELAAGMGSPDGRWFWKDQNLIFALPFLRQVFPDAVYVITLRNPYDSALSYEKLRIPPALRGRIRLLGYSLLRWQHFMVAIFSELKDHPRKLLVSYEALVSSPREQCARLCRFLAPLYAEADGEGRVDRMAQAINPRYWRHASETPFAGLSSVSLAQRELFQYLASRLDGETNDFDPSLYPFPEWSLEYCGNMSVMQWLLGSL